MLDEQMTHHWTSARAREDWSRVRRRALWEAVVDVLTKRPGELLPLEEIRTRLNVRGSNYRGLQQVPLEKIVGSEGRYGDFDRRFLPKGEVTADRWMKINQLQQHDVELPPVELYKIGDVYFVKDGNHRVSVARERGQIDIDAYVTEYEVDVPLDPSFSMRDLLLKEEYSDFLDWTNLARLRPGQRIELSALGGYLELLNHINTHRYYMALERQSALTVDEAVTSWYDNVYLPVVEAIHKHGLMRYFPGRTEADLYLWIMTHRHYLREHQGVDPGAEVATLDYASRFGQRSVLDTVSDALHSLAQAARSVARWSQPGADSRGEFVAWSNINELCPDTDISLSDRRDYQRLRACIEDHHHQLSMHWGREVSIAEAISDWCANIYQPVIATIRERRLLDDWPGHTETDLYLEAMEHLRELRAHGTTASPREAVDTLLPDSADSDVAQRSRRHNTGA
jgi:hypothetical protein